MYIYKIIFLGIIPILHRYVKYSIKKVKDDLLKILSIHYYRVVKYIYVTLDSGATFLDDEFMTLEEFLKESTRNYILNNDFIFELHEKYGVLCQDIRYEFYQKKRRNRITRKGF